MSNLEPQTVSVMPVKRLKGDAAAAQFLGCHAKTITKLRKQGKVAFLAIGRAYFYDPAELVATFYHKVL